MDWEPGDEQYSDRPVVVTDKMRLSTLIRVAYLGARLELSEQIRERVVACRRHLESALSQGVAVYGANTGVGALCSVKVAPEQARELSRNVILSHACGVGEPLPPRLARAILVAAVLNFSRGLAGVRIELVDALLRLLNEDLTPYIPAQGSVGSLTHMAHVGLTLLGQGEAFIGEELVSAEVGLRRIGMEPIEFAALEGLALVNGTPSVVGIGTVAIHDAFYLSRWADVSASMALEALQGNPSAFDPRVHAARPHPGQMKVASNILRLVKGSEILYGGPRTKLQDGLSLRTIPQVHGACRDSIARASEVVGVELNSATSNPLIFGNEEEVEVLAACNAHGEPMAQCLDVMTAAVAELGNISERRTDRLLNAHVSGLPPFLAAPGGLHSGLMIAQYVSAYLVAENKILSHPVSVDSIPMSAMQEDHVTMGTLAALNAHRVVRNVQRVIAIELLVAAQGLEFRRPAAPGVGVKATYEAIRQFIEPLEGDRLLSTDIERLFEFVRRGAWLDQLENLVGAL